MLRFHEEPTNISARSVAPYPCALRGKPALAAGAVDALVSAQPILGTFRMNG